MLALSLPNGFGRAPLALTALRFAATGAAPGSCRLTHFHKIIFYLDWVPSNNMPGTMSGTMSGTMPGILR